MLFGKGREFQKDGASFDSKFEEKDFEGKQADLAAIVRKLGGAVPRGFRVFRCVFGCFAGYFWLVLRLAILDAFWRANSGAFCDLWRFYVRFGLFGGLFLAVLRVSLDSNEESEVSGYK